METERTAFVLLGHGSRLDASNRELSEVARSVAPLLGAEKVEVAFLQLARPALDEAVEDCLASGARQVVIVPFFLFPGAHVREDIPAAVEQLRARHPGVDFRVAPVLGGHPKLAEAAAERAREVLS